MGRLKNRVNIKTCQNNLVKVILTRSFSQRFNLLGYSDTVKGITVKTYMTNLSARMCLRLRD